MSAPPRPSSRARAVACGLLATHESGPAVEEEAALPFGHEVAAEAGRTLEHRDRDVAPDLARGLQGGARGGEPGDAPADDDDAPRLAHATLRSGRATPASTSMKSSSAFSDGMRAYASPRSAAIARASMSRS